MCFHIQKRRGVAAVWAILTLALLAGFSSLAVDYGLAQVVKNELGAAADAAARAAAAQLGNGTTAARNAAVAAAAQNTAAGQPVVIDPNLDVEFGDWDETTATFTVLTGTAANNADSVRVTARRTAARGNPVRLSFASLIGKSNCDVTASAIGQVTITYGYGIVGLDYIKMSGNASDSYNSNWGALDPANTLHHGTVATNGDVTLSGSSKIDGDAYAGPGKQVKLGSGCIVTGAQGNLKTKLAYAMPSAGTYATNNNNSQVPSDYLTGARDFKMSSGDVLTLPGGVYYLHNVDLSGGSTLNFNGPTTWYVNGTLKMSGSVKTNVDKPVNLQINMVSPGGVALSGSSTLYADIYAPGSPTTISGTGALAGGIVAKNITMTGSAKIYFDSSLGAHMGAIYLVR